MKTLNSINKTARVTGLLYFLIIFTSLLSMVLGPFKLIVKGDHASTINNIEANELLFRVGIAYDLIMYACVIMLSVALYLLLKTINKNLALLAMIWRLGEAILGCLTVLCSMIVLLLVKSENYSMHFEADQIEALVGLTLNISSVILSIVFVFLSLGTIVFCYLFYKAKYIPGILAAFGIFSFSLILTGTVVNILFPFDAFMVLGAPAILFELVIGLWLMIKGVNVEYWNKQVIQ